MSDTSQNPTAGPAAAEPPIPRAHLPRDPLTVLHPERRSSAQFEALAANPSSSIIRTLFPASENPPPLSPDAGLTLGHFQIVERIRTGGMGAVFRAMDLRLSRTVAIKVLPPAQARDPSAVQRFRNEAQAAAQLDHENIARVYFIGEDQGLHFIAFEFVQGTNVRDLIQQQGRLPLEDAVNYALQIASSLAHTSAHGVVHRDIKPSNVIITRNGRAKLVDLGLARNENSDQGIDLTAPGTTLGTFDYISPEQAYDPRSADVRSDIYSLGCTLYHMLTGEPPYPEGTVMQKLLQHKGDEAPDPAARNRRVPENLAAVTRKMMAKEPRRRYQSAEELIQDLMVVAGSLGLRSVSPEGLVWISSAVSRPPFWERHLAWMATLAALLLIVGYLEFGRPNFGSTARNPSNPEVAAKSVEKPASTGTPGTKKSEPKEPVDTPSKTSIASTGDGKTAAPATTSTTEDTGSAVARLETQPSGAVSLTPGFDAALSEVGPESFNSRDLTSLGPSAIVPASATEIATAPAKITSVPPIPAETKPPVETPAADKAASPVRMIARGMEQSFATLAAACAQAEDGAVIELRYNGVRQEGPIRITKKISIVAGKSFRPGIEFVPRLEAGSSSQARMITVAQGTLELVGLDLLLSVDTTTPAEFWCLLSLQRPETVRLKGVSLTIRNPRQSPAAVIELPAASATAMPEMGMEMMARPPLEIDVAGCFIRGSADLVLARNVEPVRISIGDSILALQGSLLQARGDQPGKSTDERLDLRLDHVTASLAAGVLKLDGGAQPRRFLPVQVTASNSIFTTPAGTPLVSMSGAAPAADFRRLLAWNGRKNFYDQYTTFWSIASSDSPGQPETLDFRAWQRTWGPAAEVDPRAEPVIWMKYWENRPFADLLPSDFALDRDASNNPAVSGATTRNDAGADLETLERLGIAIRAPKPAQE